MKICTDTATIVIYDILCLKHRLNDRCDWWASRFQELKEINEGNVLFIGVGTDGCFNIEITDMWPAKETEALSAFIRCPSGSLYIGPAEEVSGDGYEPTEDEGFFIEMPAGNMKVLAWVENGCLLLNLSKTINEASNAFSRSPSVA